MKSTAKYILLAAAIVAITLGIWWYKAHQNKAKKLSEAETDSAQTDAIKAKPPVKNGTA